MCLGIVVELWVEGEVAGLRSVSRERGMGKSRLLLPWPSMSCVGRRGSGAGVGRSGRREAEACGGERGRVRLAVVGIGERAEGRGGGDQREGG